MKILYVSYLHLCIMSTCFIHLPGRFTNRTSNTQEHMSIHMCCYIAKWTRDRITNLIGTKFSYIALGIGFELSCYAHRHWSFETYNNICLRRWLTTPLVRMSGPWYEGFNVYFFRQIDEVLVDGNSCRLMGTHTVHRCQIGKLRRNSIDFADRLRLSQETGGRETSGSESSKTM